MSFVWGVSRNTRGSLSEAGAPHIPRVPYRFQGYSSTSWKLGFNGYKSFLRSYSTRIPPRSCLGMMSGHTEIPLGLAKDDGFTIDVWIFLWDWLDLAIEAAVYHRAHFNGCFASGRGISRNLVESRRCFHQSCPNWRPLSHDSSMLFAPHFIFCLDFHILWLMEKMKLMLLSWVPPNSYSPKHLSERGPSLSDFYRNTVELWVTYLGKLADTNVQWVCRWWSVEHVVVISGDYSGVQLLGLHKTSYTPTSFVSLVRIYPNGPIPNFRELS